MVELRKTADRPVVCPVNVVPTPQVEVHKSRCVGICSGEWFPEELKVVPAEMAEEASTGGAADNQSLSINQIYTKTTVTNSPTDYVEIGRPAPLQVPVEVAEEASTDDTTNEQCIYEILNNNKTTDRELSTTGYQNDEADDRASLLDDRRRSRTVG